jgi:mRNA interferase RelE/StbE
LKGVWLTQRKNVDDSSEYRIFETDEFRHKLEKLSGTNIRAIHTKLENYVYPQLREQPFFGANIRKLRGFDADVWRYRIGRFRVFYTVDEDERVVSIVTIEARKDAYR